MMVERHYDEESLIAILHSGEAAVSSDKHLSACASCVETLDAYRVIIEVMKEESVWSHRDPHAEGAARGAAMLRIRVATIENEDVSAEGLVAQLLTSPRQWWRSTVISDERYQNAGVVRRLTELSEKKIQTTPPEAVELAVAALAAAETLPENEETLQIRGAAFRQHAFSLFYIGDFTKALASVERAQEVLEQCTVSEYALARLNIVRALVYRAQERHDDAIALTRRSASTFRVFGDRQRLASAIMTEAYLLIYVRSYSPALALLVDLEKNYAGDLDAATRARALGNIAICCSNLGRVREALDSYQIAAAIFDELGSETEAARLRYCIAILLAAEGKQADAKLRLRAVQTEFERLGMLHTAVVAGLDLAELALLDNDFREVESLCRSAIRQFEAAGVAYSSEALTALTFLREAAEQRRATQEIVWHVKTYIRRLPDEPALLFAPAPLQPA